MKWVKRSLIGILLLGISYTCLVFFLILQGTQATPSNNPETILVLGVQVKGTTKETAYPSTVLKERLTTAIPYIKKHPHAIVIVCGGQGTDEPDSEASAMAHYLVNHGVKEKQIIQENTSTRTKENIVNAEKKRTLGNTVIVTSDFHMYRSLLLAKRLGISEVSGLPAASTSSAKTNTYLREIVALGYGLLFDY